MASWIRTSIPTRPSGSLGRKQISRSGRDRSSWRRRSSSTARNSAGSSPGTVSGTTRTWSRRSKAGHRPTAGRPAPAAARAAAAGTGAPGAAAPRSSPARPRSATGARLQQAAAVEDGRAPMSWGQISSGHSMRWSSAVSLSTGITPYFPGQCRAPSGARARDIRPWRPGPVASSSHQIGTTPGQSLFEGLMRLVAGFVPAQPLAGPVPGPAQRVLGVGSRRCARP